MRLPGPLILLSWYYKGRAQCKLSNLLVWHINAFVAKLRFSCSLWGRVCCRQTNCQLSETKAIRTHPHQNSLQNSRYFSLQIKHRSKLFKNMGIILLIVGLVKFHFEKSPEWCHCGGGHFLGYNIY